MAPDSQTHVEAVLISEPHARIRSGLEVSLTQHGYQVATDDGSDPLEAIEAQVPDVAVLSCDLLPDGFRICEQVVEDGIAAAIIMSSHEPTKEMVIKAARAGAKGFVVTPTSGPKLRQKVESVYSQTPQASSRAKFPIIRFGARNLSDAQKVDIIMRDVSEIRVMPQAVAKILQVTNQGDVGAHDIAAAAGSDPTIAAMVLKRANSAYYGGNGQISDLRAAVVRLGSRECRDQVVGMATSDLFPKIEKSFGFNRVWHWVHSLSCGLLAEHLSRRPGFVNWQDAFAAGLLHDIGKLILDDFLTSAYGRVVRTAHTTGITMLAAEKKVLERDHALVGSQVLERWRFPEAICQAIADHHDSQHAVPTNHANLAGAIFLADQMAKAMLVGSGGDFIVHDIPQAVWDRYGCRIVNFEALCGQLEEQLREYCSFLRINDKEAEDALDHNRDSGTAVLFDHDKDNTFLLTLFLVNQGFEVKTVSEPDAFSTLKDAPQLVVFRPADFGEANTVLKRIESFKDGPCPTVCVLEDSGRGYEEEFRAGREWLRVLTKPLDCFELLCKARELLPDVLKAKVLARAKPLRSESRC